MLTLVCLLVTTQAIYSDKYYTKQANLGIHNATPYWLWLGVHYKICKDDHVVIAPGDRINVHTERCQIDLIEGVLAPDRGNASKNITIQPWNRSVDGNTFEWTERLSNPQAIRIEPTGAVGYGITVQKKMNIW